MMRAREMSDDPVDLDRHRGMAAQRATDIRRVLADVEANAKTLRDRQGWAYTVRATITGDAGKEQGTFTGYIGTFGKSFLDVRHGFLREFNKIRDEVPTKQEVEDAKQYLLGGLPFRFTTTSAVAGQLLAAEKYGLGFDFLEKFKKEVAAVTPEDVQAVAKKYLDPKTLAIVACGPIDKDGKPLGKK